MNLQRPWRLGYNTNGFAHHRLEDAIVILAELGYEALALTLDVRALDPYAESFLSDCDRIGALLRRRQLVSVIETGARFLLDPRQKHQPTLLSPAREDRQRRSDFYRRSIEAAAKLGATVVSFWTGAPTDDAAETVLFDRLRTGLDPLLDVARQLGIVLALEPEPGMWLATIAETLEVLDRIQHPALQLSIDVGHLHCQSEGDIPAILRQSASRLANVHLEDMRVGVHDHLLFGEGEMDLPPILAALTEIGFTGVASVELSRHSHDAVRTAQRSKDWLARHLPPR